MPKKPNKQRYIVRKYIMARSASEAINLDKQVPVQDVWVDEDWKKNNPDELPAVIGFEAPEPEFKGTLNYYAQFK